MASDVTRSPDGPVHPGRDPGADLAYHSGVHVISIKLTQALLKALKHSHIDM